MNSNNLKVFNNLFPEDLVNKKIALDKVHLK